MSKTYRSKYAWFKRFRDIELGREEYSQPHEMRNKSDRKKNKLIGRKAKARGLNKGD